MPPSYWNTLQLLGQLPWDPKPCPSESLHVFHLQDQVLLLLGQNNFWIWYCESLLSFHSIKLRSMAYQVHQFLHRDPWVPYSSWNCPWASHGCQLPRLLDEDGRFQEMWLSICAFSMILEYLNPHSTTWCLVIQLDLLNLALFAVWKSRHFRNAPKWSWWYCQIAWRWSIVNWPETFW